MTTTLLGAEATWAETGPPATEVHGSMGAVWGHRRNLTWGHLVMVGTLLQWNLYIHITILS